MLNYVEMLAYCLLPNHFHLLVHITEEESENVSQQFSNMFNAYAKAINKQENRHGPLFEKPFRRKLVEDEDYLRQLIFYIHSNPKHHNVYKEFDKYQHSSYQSILSDKLTQLKRDLVFELFGAQNTFIEFHRIGLKNDIVNKFMFEHDFS